MTKLILAVNLVSFTMALGSICLAVSGIDGWGWFLGAACVLFALPSSR